MRRYGRGANVFFRNVQKDHPVIVRGEGIYLYDDEGNRYIDGCSGALVTNIGHGVEPVAEAIYRQAKTLAFSHLSRFASEPLMKLGEMVAGIAPPGLGRLYMVSGGSEATESAMKMARQYFLERDGTNSPKHLVISRWNSFHGNTVGSMSMSGIVPRRRPYQPYLLDFPHVNAPYCYRCPYGREPEECGVPCAYELQQAIDMAGAEYVSAFIAEPVVGAAAGALVPPAAYHRAVRDICDRHDVLYIADEVMTGFGRTGEHFAVDHWDAVPDMMTLAKGMGSGYMPLGGVLVREDIWSTFYRGTGRFVHGHTYGGNPLASAAGVAVLDYYLEHDLVQNSSQMGAMLMEKLEPLGRNPLVGDLRGIGLMIGIELVRDKGTKEPFPRSPGAVAEKATGLLMDAGVVVYPGGGTVDGEAGDHFLVGPPLTIDEAGIEELAEGIISGLNRLAEIES